MIMGSSVQAVSDGKNKKGKGRKGKGIVNNHGLTRRKPEVRTAEIRLMKVDTKSMFAILIVQPYCHWSVIK